MELIADLHIHSHYSRATGRQLNLEQLDLWAAYKGIAVLATGDCTHPGWLAEMAQRLEPAEEGLYVLKPEFKAPRRPIALGPTAPPATRFVISGEISSIYKKNGLTRKVHTLVLMPSLAAGEKLSQRLGQMGNVTSDGRPILGLDAKYLLEVILEVDAASLVIPAHIWTPWFSVLGSKSGFDSLAECYEDLLPNIYALETGLSSDPPMNWRLSCLDRFALVSNSDAHSPQKIGREANIFDIELSYPALAAALKTKAGFLGTMEFFPDEGKYHLDGHRKCQQRLEPAVSKKFQGRCPVCGRPLTLGVLHRVLDLVDRPEGEQPAGARPCQHLIPLPEVIAEVLQCGPGTKKVEEMYFRLLEKLGPELEILRQAPLAVMAQEGGALLAAGIDKMRREEVHIQGGYDGEYGIIRLFNPTERQELTRQAGFWSLPAPSSGEASYLGDCQAGAVKEPEPPAVVAIKDDSPMIPGEPWLQGLNPDQLAAATHSGGPLLVQAGPGAGKTRTLTHRVAHLMHGGLPPEQVLAVTFTRQAAGEMTERLHQLLGDRFRIDRIAIQTFHALGAKILQESEGVSRQISSEEERRPLLQEAARNHGLDAKTLDRLISRSKQEILYPEDLSNEAGWLPAYWEYEEALANRGCWDFDDLVSRAVRLLRQRPEILAAKRQQWTAILVDEYQDLNQAQYELLRLLAPPDHANLFVIGDPNQAIYGFRGAKPEYFHRFCQDWPSARKVFLAETYRLPTPVLELARTVLDEAALVPTSTVNPSHLAPVLLETANAQAEAEQIARAIDFLVGGGSHLTLEDERLRYADNGQATSFKDIAVLYRFHALGQVCQNHLQAAGIPCQLAREVAGPEYTGIDRLAEKVSLLTLHAAKGLEFQYIFIIGCEAGLLPFEPAADQSVDPEEERRLLYVGLTRASRQVILSYAHQRYLWGEKGSGRLAGWVQSHLPYLAESPVQKPLPRKIHPKQHSLF